MKCFGGVQERIRSIKLLLLKLFFAPDLILLSLFPFQGNRNIRCPAGFAGLRDKAEAEPYVAVAVISRIPVPVARPHVPRVIVPTATTVHAVGFPGIPLCSGNPAF